MSKNFNFEKLNLSSLDLVKSITYSLVYLKKVVLFTRTEHKKYAVLSKAIIFYIYFTLYSLYIYYYDHFVSKPSFY